MSYTALYRKFRPATFEGVKGQDHIVTTLRNQIMADRIGHAYLFTGTRGTGKTTIINTLIQIMEEGGLKVAVAAPTGAVTVAEKAVQSAEAATACVAGVRGAFCAS